MGESSAAAVHSHSTPCPDLFPPLVELHQQEVCDVLLVVCGLPALALAHRSTEWLPQWQTLWYASVP